MLVIVTHVTQFSCHKYGFSSFDCVCQVWVQLFWLRLSGMGSTLLIVFVLYGFSFSDCVCQVWVQLFWLCLSGMSWGCGTFPEVSRSCIPEIKSLSITCMTRWVRAWERGREGEQGISQPASDSRPVCVWFCFCLPCTLPALLPACCLVIHLVQTVEPRCENCSNRLPFGDYDEEKWWQNSVYTDSLLLQ